ncbi:MAG: hypoxanthine phosphoribosyltransferase [Methylacidiphilales bacterium]|nr:hypoxanthine phosphoribosyltransferase [Candidatus Methylacidiphilales bacterium]MDW8348658.1 hypoxanthine phosphoribosyltransferase [Verrucomicrobiae bacterium]
MPDADKFAVLIGEEALRRRVIELGSQISKDYQNTPLTLIALLNGSIFFLTDLIRALDIRDLHIECWRISSYCDTYSTGKVTGLEHCRAEVHQRHVLIVDDIYDTGLTLSHVQEHVRTLQPLSIKTCVLLEKKTKHQVLIPVEYVGFTIPDEFVVGYGLDYNGRYRELPDIRIFRSN